jgi:hypothetical protein
MAGKVKTTRKSVAKKTTAKKTTAKKTTPKKPATAKKPRLDYSNPYSAGNYNLIFAEFRNRKTVTLDELALFIMESLQATDKRKHKVGPLKGQPVNPETFGTLQPIGESAALASAQVILSPTLVKEGDTTTSQGRGNMSAKGHRYYCEHLKGIVTKLEDGTKEVGERRYRLKWRSEVLPVWNLKTRNMTIETAKEWEAQQAEKIAKRETAKAEKEAKQAEGKAKREANKIAKAKADKALEAKRETAKKLRESKEAEGKAKREAKQAEKLAKQLAKQAEAEPEETVAEPATEETELAEA